ncbi:MAG: hypothetical protein ABW201_17860 [Candidatus Thiodiazotropha sp.]
MALLFTIGVLVIDSQTSESCDVDSIQKHVAETDQAQSEPFVETQVRPCRYSHAPLVQRDLTAPSPDNSVGFKRQECSRDGE